MQWHKISLFKKDIENWVVNKTTENKLEEHVKKKSTVCKAFAWVILRTIYYGIAITFFLSSATYFTARV